MIKLQNRKTTNPTAYPKKKGVSRGRGKNRFLIMTRKVARKLEICIKKTITIQKWEGNLKTNAENAIRIMRFSLLRHICTETAKYSAKSFGDPIEHRTSSRKSKMRSVASNTSSLIALKNFPFFSAIKRLRRAFSARSLLYCCRRLKEGGSLHALSLSYA